MNEPSKTFAESPPELEFTVMPHPDEGSQAVPPPVPGPPKKLLPPDGPKKPGNGYNWKKIAGWIIGILLLAALGYFLAINYSRIKNALQPREQGSEKITPPSYNSGTDTDQDGLSDDKERELGTDPKNPDSDGDGLADGDEINIYGSDPLLFDTDADTYDDGQEAANGFSPLRHTTEKMTEEERLVWANAAARFGLHEPTATTLAAKTILEPTAKKSVYQNTYHKFEISIPEIFSYREADNGQRVGIYVTNRQPDDDDVTSDPISIQVAVKTSGQSLRDWIAVQYQPSDYQKQENITVNSLAGVRILNMPNDTCTSNQTLFTKDSKVIILTWTCNEIAAYGPYYEQIVQSFKFIQ